MAKKIYSIVQNILIGIAAVLVIFFLTLPLILKINPCVILSGSMEPKISTGSIAFINTKERTPEIGDVICYKAGDIMITHRVAEKTQDGYVTKGDANEENDSKVVAPDQVIGTYIFNIPLIGYAAMYLKSKSGIVMMVTLFIVFILLGKLLE